MLARVCGAVRLTYAPKSITPCLRDKPPELLRLATTTLSLPGYNPSILKADGGGFLVSVRQDWLTQCSLKRQSSREAVKRAYEGARDRKRHTVIARTNSSSFARLRVMRRVPGRHPPYDPRVCDTMQFATGLEIEEERGRALIAYGVNDCSAHVATMPLATLRRLLWPEGRPPVPS